MGGLFFNGMCPYIDPGTGGKITGMIAAADKILSLAGNDTTRPARQQSGPHEIPGHARHRPRSRSEIEVRGKIRPGSCRGKAVRRSRPRQGPRHHQRRPVRPSCLSDALTTAYLCGAVQGNSWSLCRTSCITGREHMIGRRHDPNDFDAATKEKTDAGHTLFYKSHCDWRP
jgi:hypothetical protein